MLTTPRSTTYFPQSRGPRTDDEAGLTPPRFGVHVENTVMHDDLEHEPTSTGNPAGLAGGVVDATPADPAGLEALLDYLNRSRGFDFTGYKRSTLERRVARRMHALGVDGYAEYIDYLEVRPDEFPLLFNTILINVTSFYRDAPAWAALRDLVERRLTARPSNAPIRVWSAGCASGEEPFTLAMVLADVLGTEAYGQRVKIYATDIDDEALAQARLATYSQKAVDGVPPEALQKYFTPCGTSYLFSKELRRGVIFGRHDLVQDAPISRIDFLVCRNTLMYFNAETQARVLSRLHFALNDDGLLFLGKAEMLLTHANLFAPTDIKLRLFSRTRGRTRERALADEKAALVADPTLDDRNRLFRVAFDRAPSAQIVIDPRGLVVLVNSRAAHLFALTPQDVSRPFHDLEVSYRPADLRSCLDRVRKDRRPMHLREVERTLGSGEKTYFDIEVLPLLAETGAVLGMQISFIDITEAQRLQSELRRANLGLETAHEELQSTSEELETTNEELQSTVEELETTNEELQSTNEELETMNEELQSTVQELQTMNEELRQRGEELVELSAFFGSVLGSLRSGVAVLDRDLLVRAWNPKMEELWGLRADETQGRPFVTLDIGMPIDQLAGAIRSCLSNGEGDERVLDCTNRRGRHVRCRVTVSPLRGEPACGVTLVVDEASE